MIQTVTRRQLCHRLCSPSLFCITFSHNPHFLSSGSSATDFAGLRVTWKHDLSRWYRRCLILALSSSISANLRLSSFCPLCTWPIHAGQRCSGEPHCAVHGLHSTTLQQRLQQTASLTYCHQCFPACVFQSSKALGHVLGFPLHDATWGPNSSESCQTLATITSTREKSVNIFLAKCTLCMTLIWMNVNISTLISPGTTCRDQPSPLRTWSRRPVLSNYTSHRGLKLWCTDRKGDILLTSKWKNITPWLGWAFTSRSSYKYEVSQCSFVLLSASWWVASRIKARLYGHIFKKMSRPQRT